MKQIIYQTAVRSVIAMMILCVVCASCTPSSKIVVYGNSGTQIYNSDYKMLGTIPDKGYVKVKLPKKTNTPFLLSHEANGNLYVPFAVDYKYRSHRVEGTIALLGLFSGVGTIPSLVWAVASGSNSQWCDEYNYIKKQTTNQDFTFAPFVDNGEKKSALLIHKVDVTSPVAEASSARKRSLNDNAKMVTGIYTGTGHLSQGGNAIEEYASIQVIVTRMDNNNVWIDVVESGEPFFSSKTQYQVEKKGRNTYMLSLNGMPDAYITIDNHGTLTYMHPQVKIDGEFYTLNIEAKKE